MLIRRKHPDVVATIHQSHPDTITIRDKDAPTARPLAGVTLTTAYLDMMVDPRYAAEIPMMVHLWEKQRAEPLKVHIRGHYDVTAISIQGRLNVEYRRQRIPLTMGGATIVLTGGEDNGRVAIEARHKDQFDTVLFRGIVQPDFLTDLLWVMVGLR